MVRTERNLVSAVAEEMAAGLACALSRWMADIEHVLDSDLSPQAKLSLIGSIVNCCKQPAGAAEATG
jgi:hypothetical protein